MKFINIDIDFLDIYSKNLDEEYRNFHTKMAEIFGFPHFYGKNLAAFIDCLSDLRTKFLLAIEQVNVRHRISKIPTILINLIE